MSSEPVQTTRTILFESTSVAVPVPVVRNDISSAQVTAGSLVTGNS